MSPIVGRDERAEGLNRRSQAGSAVHGSQPGHRIMHQDVDVDVDVRHPRRSTASRTRHPAGTTTRSGGLRTHRRPRPRHRDDGEIFDGEPSASEMRSALSAEQGRERVIARPAQPRGHEEGAEHLAVQPHPSCRPVTHPLTASPNVTAPLPSNTGRGDPPRRPRSILGTPRYERRGGAIGTRAVPASERRIGGVRAGRFVCL